MIPDKWLFSVLLLHSCFHQRWDYIRNFPALFQTLTTEELRQVSESIGFWKFVLSCTVEKCLKLANAWAGLCKARGLDKNCARWAMRMAMMDCGLYGEKQFWGAKIFRWFHVVMDIHDLCGWFIKDLPVKDCAEVLSKPSKQKLSF